MTLSFLIDVNVWVALVYPRHPSHSAAARWLTGLPEDSTLVMCRIAQLSVLRLLTTASVMGEDVATMRDAWRVLDELRLELRIEWRDEPRGVEDHLRHITNRAGSSPKLWADFYLAAFAESASLTLVTFDKALAKSMPGSVLLTHAS